MSIRIIQNPDDQNQPVEVFIEDGKIYESNTGEEIILTDEELESRTLKILS